MNNLKLTLARDVLKKDHRWLDRDYKKGEQLYLFTGATYGCIGKKGLAFTKTGELPFFELPATALSIKHNNKDFGIFMTEQGMGYQLLYCKELPIDHMELLTKTQSNVHLVDPKKNKPKYKSENQILKVYVNGPYIHCIDGQLEDVEPLF